MQNRTYNSHFRPQRHHARPRCMTQPFFDHDAHLIAIARGDHHAFIALYRHEAPSMLALAKKMLGRTAESEDAVKDAFILIWKYAESCDVSTTSARSWMYSIFRHRVMSVLRQPGRMAPARSSWTDHLPAQPSGRPGISSSYAAFQRLDPVQRRPLLMAYYHGCTTRQIAANLGSTTEQVQRHIRQALHTLHTTNQS